VRELTGTIGDGGVFDFTEGRKLKQLVLLNAQAFYLRATLVRLLNDEAQTLWVALLYARRRVAALLLRRRFLPRREIQTRNNLLNHLRALRRQIIGAFRRRHPPTPCHRHHHRHHHHLPSALPLHHHSVSVSVFASVFAFLNAATAPLSI